MSMTQEQSIEMQLVDTSGHPVAVAGVLAEVHLFTTGNYRYGFKVGCTNETGHLTVSGKDLGRIRRDRAHENLMDYNTPIEECDPIVRIVIPSERQLREQYENVMRLYERPPEWAAHWPSNRCVIAQDNLVELTGQTTRVNIIVQSTGLE